MVDIAHLVHATDRAVRRAALLRQELPLHIRRHVARQRNPRIPALLGAIVHQPELADVQIPPARPAAPVIRLPVRDRLLKVIEPRVAPPRQLAAPCPTRVRSRSPSGFNCPLPSWIIPMVELNPSASARSLTVSASLGFAIPPPTTELMFT